MKTNETIDYSSLIELSKKRYKKNPFVQSGIPSTTGRRLNGLREHTNTLKVPDISSIVVSKGSTKSGKSYHLDSEKERKKVYRTCWLNHYCEVIHLLNTTLRNEDIWLWQQEHTHHQNHVHNVRRLQEWELSVKVVVLLVVTVQVVDTVVLGTRIAKYVGNTLRKITCNSDNTRSDTHFIK